MPSGLKATEITCLLMAAEGGDLLARRHLPQPRRLVRRAGGEARAIGAEGDGSHRILVAAQDGDLLARRHLPQPRRLVLRAGGEQRAIGAEGDGSHRLLVADAAQFP